MAASTIVKTAADGKLSFAALGGGAYNTSTGALEAGALDLLIDFCEGDLSWNDPKRGDPVPFRHRTRTVSTPSFRRGADIDGDFSFTFKMRAFTSAASEIIEDVINTGLGNPSGDVGTNWESTSASASGAGDAPGTFSFGLKIEFDNEGDATDAHARAFNYAVITSGSVQESAEGCTVSVSGVLLDRPAAFYIGT